MPQILKSVVFCTLLATGLPAYAQSAEETIPKNPFIRLQVIDVYADVHAGPGRGYPVFYAVEEGETIILLAKRPGWYEIRLQNGRTGWVTSAQISRTIQTTGEPADLPEVSFGDYLKNSFRVGLTTGIFTKGELKDADHWSATFGYRFISWAGIEAEYGKLYGEDIRGDFYGLNLTLEPFSRWRVSPYLLVGAGEMDVDSQPKLIPLEIQKSDFVNYGIGANYYLGRNFLIKGEYRSLTVSTDNKDAEVATWKLGFNTFF
ncbi:SH3 domain-containing protein [Alteromonadaceae bacterium 2753L.S.0a.02]|nr:SH3 domain-containing protein [Alteromonadaceae bacterium 2753L.S.0a.02]